MKADERRIEGYAITDYPDYVPQKPPDVYKLRRFSYLDEYEKTWGRPWGAPGIGRLREVGLVRPTEHEGNKLWMQDPNFFLLRYRQQIDVPTLIQNHQAYADLLETCGVRVQWMEF